jgi:hypothetical protein
MQTSDVSTVQNNFKNGGYYTALKFNDIKSGSNDCFKTGPGWDPVTGLGSYSISGFNDWGIYAGIVYTKTCKSTRLQSNVVLINLLLGLFLFLKKF